MATKTFNIEINGISLSTNAVNSLLDKLDDLEKRLQDISGKGLDTGEIKQSLTSIRKELKDNVNGWEKIADRIDDVSGSVLKLERLYKNLDNPLKTSEIQEYNGEVNKLASNFKNVANLVDKLDNLGGLDKDLEEASKAAKKLADNLKDAKTAEEQLGTKLTVNVGGMSLQFDDVNQGIGLLEDKLYQLSATGQKDTQVFKDISKEIINLKNQVIQVDSAIDESLGGGLSKLVKGVGSIASLASVGEGIGQMFGLEDSALDESLLKFAALSLVLLGVAEVLREMATNTGLASQALKSLGAIADTTLGGLGKVLNTVSFGVFAKGNKAIDSFGKKLKSMDLINEMDKFRKAAMLEEEQDAHSGWSSLISNLEKVKEGLSEDINFKSYREAAEQFAETDDILKSLLDSFDEGIIDEDLFNKAKEALENFKSGLSEDAVQAGNLKQLVHGMGVYFAGLPPSLTKTLKGLLAITKAFKSMKVAIKGIAKATIVLAVLQVALEAITWLFDKLGKLWTSFAGDDSLATQFDTATQSINLANEALSRYVDNLLKLADSKVISNQTKITESIKLYEKALKDAIKTQQLFNIEAEDISKNFSAGNTWFTGQDIETVEDFNKLFEILLRAVLTGTDRFEALKNETEEVKKKFGGNWFLRMWNTSSDAAADFGEVQKAVIADILNRINRLDLSKGTDEVKKFIDILNTPAYSISLANVENLFPEEEWAKVLAANIKQIREYYKLIGDLLSEAERDAQAINDKIKANEIASIRDRFEREREELENGYELEIRDAADNQRLKESIDKKYNLLREQLLKRQAREQQSILNLIQANLIDSMREGLKKRLAELELARQQELLSASDSEINVGEQLAAINAKYNRLILEAKLKFYDDRKKMLSDFLEYNRLIAALIENLQYEDYSTHLGNRYLKKIEDLGYTPELIEDVKEYYNKLRDASNEEVQKLLVLDKQHSQALTLNDIDNENQRNKERLDLLKLSYDDGNITVKEFHKLREDETEQHLALLEVIYLKGEHNLIKITNDANQTINNNNATALSERIGLIDEAFNKIEAKTKVSKIGIINYKDTKASLKKAQSEYSNIFNLITEERNNLQEQFDKKLISFGDFRTASKELDDLEKNVEEASENVDMQMNDLLTNTIQSITQYAGQYVNALGGLWSTYNEIQMAKIEQELARLDEEYDMLEEAYSKQEELTLKHTDKLMDIEDELKESRGDRRAHLIEQLNAERAAQLASLLEEQKIEKLKEANEKKQLALEKKRREQEKKNSIVQATINTYTAMTNALAVQPWFVGLALSAVALAMGLAQVAMIKKLKYANGGLLKGNSHNKGGIPVGNTGIEVEGDEYVVNKRSTSKNLPLIDYINSSDRRLTKDDLIRFYDSGKLNVTRSTKNKFATGGLLPDMNVSNPENRLVITDDRPVVVQVVDIVNSADNYRLVQVLAGLESKESI